MKDFKRRRWFLFLLASEAFVKDWLNFLKKVTYSGIDGEERQGWRGKHLQKLFKTGIYPVDFTLRDLYSQWSALVGFSSCFLQFYSRLFNLTHQSCSKSEGKSCFDQGQIFLFYLTNTFIFIRFFLSGI